MSSFDAKRDLKGIVSSLHTPFSADDKIDARSLERLIDHCADAGCCGVLVAAVAGEVGGLSADERRELLAVTTARVPAHVKVVAGVSAGDIATSIALSEQAASFGVPMVMWQPPPETDVVALENALRAMGDHGVQVMLQDLDWGGPGIAAETIRDLADAVPALTAVKVETVPAGPKYSVVDRLTEGRLHLSGGWAVMQMLDGLARGLDAFIPSGLLPWHTRLFECWQRGDRVKAREMFEQMLPIMAFSNQHIDVSGRFWKLVRVRQGIFDTAHCRLPKALDAVQQAEAEYLCERVLRMEAMA